jgi:hypothetical protein
VSVRTVLIAVYQVGCCKQARERANSAYCCVSGRVLQAGT